MLPWQAAFWCAGGLLAFAVLSRLGRWSFGHRAAPFAREAGVVFALFGLWQLAGTFSLMGVQHALARGARLWRLERTLRLPSETSVQHLVMPYRWLIEVLNLYYDTLHFSVMICFLIWLFARHREHYPAIRTTIIIVTGSCLLIQFVPVAPPRMLPWTGLVDTAIEYGQSVYGPMNAGAADQLSAMPSVHVGWAAIVALGAIRVLRSRWRWLWLAYPVMTMLVVVATANHYWADGIVAVALMCLSLLVQAAGRRAGDRLRRLLPHDQREGEAVVALDADGLHGGRLKAGFGGDHLGEPADALDEGVRHGRVDDVTVTDDVVRDDQAAGSGQP
jgi:hypothetical protein